MKLRSSSLRSSGDKSLDGKVFDLFRKHNCTVLGAGAATPVLGAELVTNGDFSNGTTGWDPQATATLTVSGGMMEITCTGAGYGTASRTVSLVIGKTYWLQASSPDSGVAVRINNATSGSPLASLALTSSPTFVLYTATEATVSVAMHANSNVAGTKRKFGQITLKEFSGYTYGNPPFRNYFDSVGTDILDSVTQVDQPVGLVLDAAGTTGPELASQDNATFRNNAAPTFDMLTGATFSNATDKVSVGYDNTVLSVVNGKSYQVTIPFSVASGSVVFSLRAGGALGTARASSSNYTTGGAWSFVYAATATEDLTIRVSSNTGAGATSVTITGRSVRELTGNHATQPTTGSKPTLRRGLVNLLTQSDFQNGVTDAPTRGGLVTASSLAGYGGALAFGHDGSTTSFGYKNFTHTAGSAYTFAAIVAMDDGNAPTFANVFDGTTGANSFGVVCGGALIDPRTLTATLITPGLYLVCGVYVASGTTYNYGLLKYATNSNRTFKVTRYGLFTGAVTAQQILAAGGIPLTTTAPASSALGNYWFQYDPDAPGDFLQTGITTGNEGWVCAGVTPANTTTAMSIINAGEGTSTVPGIWLFSDGIGSWRTSAAEGSLRTQQQTPMLGTTSQVLSMGWNSTTLTLGLNNVETSTPKVGAGSWSSGANTLRIGMYQGASLPFNGAMSVTVICPTLPPAADRALIRAWVASRQGQKL